MVTQVRHNPQINPVDHLGLVAKIVIKHASLRPGQALEETEEFSDGVQGLYHAIDRFDPSRGLQFSTYAYYCIRGYILKQRGNRTRRGSHNIYAMPNESIECLLRYSDSERDRRQQEARMDLHELLDKIPPAKARSKQALIGWFLQGKNLKQIASELGISRERARQHKEQALEFLQREVSCAHT